MRRSQDFVVHCAFTSCARRCGQAIFLKTPGPVAFALAVFIQKCKLFVYCYSKMQGLCLKKPEERYETYKMTSFFLGIMALFFFALCLKRLDPVSSCLALSYGSSRSCLALVSGCLVIFATSFVILEYLFLCYCIDPDFPGT